MALQTSYPVKNTDIIAPGAYVKVIQSNINFWDETRGRVDFSLYSSNQARINWNWPFETLVYTVVPSVDTTVEDFDPAELSEIDASIWLDEATLATDGVTIRKQLYAFLKTQTAFLSATDV